MKLELDLRLASQYKSRAQIARIVTESWVLNNSYCLSCGEYALTQFNNNNPIADFFSKNCKSDYELKSTFRRFNNKIVDGSYEKMILKITAKTNPSFLFLSYSEEYRVSNYFCIPNFFFIPSIIERRKPLSSSARRAGWVGCNILLNELPQSGKVYFIKEGKILERSTVLEKWEKTNFLIEKNTNTKSWLLETMSLIDNFGDKQFSLSEVYDYIPDLAQKFPNNNNLKAKLRQQLQYLRNEGYINFLGNGIYQRK